MARALELRLASLGLNKLGERGDGAGALVLLDELAVLEELDGGVAVDAVLGAGGRVGGAVDLGDGELALGGGGQLVPGGREALAVAAPGGVAGKAERRRRKKEGECLGRRRHLAAQRDLQLDKVHARGGLLLEGGVGQHHDLRGASGLLGGGRLRGGSLRSGRGRSNLRAGSGKV